MHKYLLSLYLLLGTIALYGQKATKIANFDLFSWQEKPCKYNTKKKNHLRVKNGEMKIVSKSYPEINSFVLKEIEAGDKYHVFTAHNTKAIRSSKIDYFFNDTIIRTNDQLILIRPTPLGKQHSNARVKTKIKILTQLDDTHWTISYHQVFQQVPFANIFNAFKAGALHSYIDHLQSSYISMIRKFFPDIFASIELQNTGHEYLCRITHMKQNSQEIFPLSKSTISSEWLIMHLFLQHAYIGYDDYVSSGKNKYRNRVLNPDELY